MKIPFAVEHIDLLGQGVSKLTDTVTFIPKTLPGESGTAVVRRRKKGVAFAELESLEHLDGASEHRRAPACPHYQACPGCHFLHTTYELEIEIKRANLARLFRAFAGHEALLGHEAVHTAPQRVGYRNRMQLHYDLEREKLGLVHALHNEIVEIPECLLPSTGVRVRLRQLYDEGAWRQKVLQNGSRQGHVEIYERGDTVTTAWNKPYAHGGFTQVNQPMNQALVSAVTSMARDIFAEGAGAKGASSAAGRRPLVLDLFGGGGNLSRELVEAEVLVVDSRPSTAPGFAQADLYKTHPSRIAAQLRERGLGHGAALMLLDPPRSGMKNLAQWADAFKAAYVLYVSCNPPILLRDLRTLVNYDLEQLLLFDLFPATYHFETVALMKRRA